MFSEKYAKHYEMFNRSKPYKQEIEFVYSWAGEPKKILDLGCGIAHYWKYYPKAVKISGLEKSKEMINRSPYHDRIANYDVTEAIACAWEKVDLVTALFDVINYIPVHNWWDRLPLKKGGYYIFDLWNADKVKKDGFRKTVKVVDGVTRVITPVLVGGGVVDLKIEVMNGWAIEHTEMHRLYIYDRKTIEKFCGDSFEIEEVKETESWQQWLKLRRK